MVCDLEELLPALSRDGWMLEADTEILARYWNERQSEAHNLEMIGYWLDMSRDRAARRGPNPGSRSDPSPVCARGLRLEA